MTLEIRSGVRGAALPGHDPGERQALRLAPDTRQRDADPGHIIAQAVEHEQSGVDSALVAQSSSWPDPWLVAAWALAATSTLRLVPAHRIGTTAPTVAARSLATLHRLSGGRAGVHLILGSSDLEVGRDGDNLPKEVRYRRAAEFLEIFTRTLTSREPFDFDGEFYQVRDAVSGLPPVRPELSFAGTSPAGIALAGRYADVYGIPTQPIEQTRELIATVQAAAAEHDSRIRIWRNASFILGDTDAAAADHAERLAAQAVHLGTRLGPDPLWITRPGRIAVPDELEQAIANVAGRAVVASPETAAELGAQLWRAGVDILQISTPLETPEDLRLRRRLISSLRAATGGVRDPASTLVR
ncbi:LLM class flavin-dependent oxidoreductase [Micromonospora arborensis]|uniref:LLM class flavin-dependent oxidoreductase n=1 Tax=Micromonospora arborensis TaxID=2116518 RepID=A0A318NB44_9ACTN|nr:LLM class flavin-dependent oxidoreductase [Micromonospora arborensis]PYC63417.1 LLM class flavin-dependent oxidoreductase [Micromonospora arborensis]